MQPTGSVPFGVQVFAWIAGPLIAMLVLVNVAPDAVNAVLLFLNDLVIWLTEQAAAIDVG